MSRDRYAFGTFGTCAAYLDTSPIARSVHWAMRICGASSDNTEFKEASFYEAEDDEAQPSAAHKEPHTTSAGEGVETYHTTCANHVIANHQNNEVHKWPLGRRIFIAAVISWYTFVVYAASAIYIIGIPDVMIEHGIDEQKALLGLSLYVLAYGLGPMLWAPLSELEFIGRAPIYASTFLAFFAFSILAATTQSWGGFLTVRFLQAFFGSPCLAIGGASMHDLFPTLTVPYSLTVWVAAAYCGPALGPLIASYLVPAKGWRWGMWEIVWLAAPTILLMSTLPETYEPTIAAQQVSKLRKKPAQDVKGGSKARNPSAGLIAKALRDAVVRPVQITLLDPAITVANLYTAFMYGTYYTFFDAIPRVYPVLYGFTTGQLGLVFLCIFVACVVAGAVYSLYIHRNATTDDHHYSASHERCLRPALLASTLPPVGLFLFGWTSDGTIHWIVSIIGITIYAAGTFVILQCLGVYLPRIYPAYSASLFAANDFCRSLIATAAIHIGIPLYSKLGISHGVSILGAMSVLGIPGMWFIYSRGPALRAKSRFAVSMIPEKTARQISAFA